MKTTIVHDVRKPREIGRDDDKADDASDGTALGHNPQPDQEG